MLSAITQNRDWRFASGWLILLVLSLLSFLQHFVLVFLEHDPTLFVGWTAFNLYSTVVLLIPFRRAEKWAWYCTWILALGFAGLIFFNDRIGLDYLIAAAVAALGLFLTHPTFFGEA